VSGWDGNEIGMVFDGASGNALDAFDYTADELRRRADELDGIGWFTVNPSPFITSSPGLSPGAPKEPPGGGETA
jgi:hypothetical protein